MEGSQIFNLPDHCLQIILDYLPVSDLLNAERVCRSWNCISGNVWKLKNKVTFTGNLDYDDFDAALSICGKYITDLEVCPSNHRGCGWSLNSDCNKHSAQIINPIGSYCKNLKHLKLFNLCFVSSTVFSFLFKCMSSRLISLHIKGGINQVDESSIKIMLEIATNLENLSLSAKINFSSGGESLMKLSTKCEYLDIQNCKISENKLPNIIKRLVNLNTLILGNIPGINQLLPEFHTTHPNLKYLDLIGDKTIFESSLNSLIYMPNLKILKLSHLETLTSETIVSLAEGLQKQLELFHCTNCPNVTNSGFIRMIELCTKLKSLNVSYCTLVSTRFLIDVLFSFQLKKRRIPLEIISLQYESLPENHKKILENESHPLLIMKYR